MPFMLLSATKACAALKPKEHCSGGGAKRMFSVVVGGLGLRFRMGGFQSVALHLPYLTFTSGFAAV